MSVIYFGTGSFALPALRAVARSVSLVVTQPDRPSGRGMRLQPSPVKLLALELGLRVETPERCRAPEFVEVLGAERADILLVASYGQILSQRVLDSAARGGVNLHGSILPRYRGAAPIQRCILAGELESGVTLMQMDKGMDTGGIIDITRTQIGSDETYGDLQDRLAEIAAALASRWLPMLLAGNYSIERQEEAKATYAPKVEKADAELSFHRPAFEEYNRFRAFTPAPGAFVQTAAGRLRVWKARMSALSGPAGEVLSVSPLTAAFRDGSLELHEVQPEGKKRMSGKDFANGARFRPGSCLV